MKDRDKEKMHAFRLKLKELRLKKNWTQHELASRCNVTRSKISALESDENSNLTLTTLFELAEGLGVEAKDLLDF